MRCVTHSTTGWIALTAAALSLGCGAARARKANELALATADTRVLEGCYDCLLNARAVYERLSTDKNAPRVPKGSPSIVARLFETTVLIALREKELALDSRASIERARTLIPRVPPSLEAKRVIELVDAVLPDGLGLPMKAMDALQRRNRPFLEKIDGELAWIEQAPLTPAVRKYIALSVDCSYSDRRRAPGDTVNTLAKRREVPINAPPLVAYRAAHCAKIDTLALKRVLVAATTFDEAGYSLAGLTAFLAGETGGDDVRPLFDRAYQRFPRAPGIAYLTGLLQFAARRLHGSKSLFRQGARRSSRTRPCLAAEDDLPDEPEPGLAGHSNGHAVHRPRPGERCRGLLLARGEPAASEGAGSRADRHRDGESANEERGNILTLAGIIEHEQDDLGIAERTSKARGPSWKGDGNCTAAFYLGSVLNKRERWLEASASFDSAMVCYDGRVQEVTMKIEEVRASTQGTAAFRARRIAILEEELADRRKRYYSSAFNVASMSARIGNITRAEELLGVAAQSPDLADQVAKLRGLIAEAARQAQPVVKGARAARPRAPL